jgi:predicted RNA-binding protein
MRYWIGVAAKDHVQRGVKGGFCQLCHGKAQPLRRMQQGDWIIYYSPKQEFEGNSPCQAFTAIGTVSGTETYAFEMLLGFTPFRRDIQFLQEAKPAAIRPLIQDLSFIKDKSKWAYSFRYGHLEITSNDFELIATQMLGFIPNTSMA